MTLRCQAIVFDLDGVLVDSNPIAERHWTRWAGRHGLAAAPILAVHHGRPTVETVRLVAPHLDAAAEARVLEREAADDTCGLTAWPGAAPLCAMLPPARWTIATSATRRTATTRLRHVGLPIPSTLVTSDDVRQGKPAPDAYLLAAGRLGLPVGACVVIEDAPAGIEAALAAGAMVVGVASSQPADRLLRATTVVDRLDALQVSVDVGGLTVKTAA